MNDRYLYRAKRIDNGEWILGSLIQASYLGSIRSWISYEQEDKVRLREISQNKAVWRAFEVRTDTICQCTGLKDKNGNLIWENDIVSFTHSKITRESLAKDLGFPDFEKEEYKRNYAIEFVNTYCTYGLRFRNKSIHFPCKASTLWMHDCIVVGNIFDNPELLEVEHE